MTKIGRNAPCPCGSGLKYKRCCEEKDFGAAVDKVLGPLGPQEEAEICLFDRVYQCILAGVWFAFHEPAATLPETDVLEDFYREIYGYDLDPGLIDEIILPLSPRAIAQIQSTLARTRDKIIDLAPPGVQPELPLAPESPPNSR